MKNELEVVSNSNQNANDEKIYLNIEQILSAATEDATLKVLDRLLRSRGIKSDLVRTDDFERIHKLDPKIAEDIIRSQADIEARKYNEEIQTRQREGELRVKAIDNALNIEQRRASVMADKGIFVGAYAIPVAISTSLALFDRTFFAVFLLIMCFGFTTAIFFLRWDALESLITKFRGDKRKIERDGI